MKAGVFPPDYELEAYRALAAEFPGDSYRFDPNAVWSTEQAIRFGQAIEGLRNDYLEDPVFGLHGMRRTREMVRVPLATNTVVVNFEQLAANVLDTGGGRDPARYHVLGRHPRLREGGRRLRDVSTRRGGAFVRRTGDSTRHHAAPGRGDSRISLSPPTRTTITSRTNHRGRPDAHMKTARSPCPTGPGLGVKLDRDKLREYSELYQRLGGYPYDQDPAAAGLDSHRPERPLGGSQRRSPGLDPSLITQKNKWPPMNTD